MAPPFGEKQREELSRAALYSQQGSRAPQPKQSASASAPSAQLRHYSSAGPDIQKSPFTTGQYLIFSLLLLLLQSELLSDGELES